MQLSKLGFIIPASYSAVNLFWLSSGSIYIYCNAVNILDWVVSLIRSLENSFMVMHVEICMLGSLKGFLHTYQTCIRNSFIRNFRKDNCHPTDEVKCAFVNISVLIHEYQPNFFEGFDLTNFSLLIILLDKL